MDVVVVCGCCGGVWMLWLWWSVDVVVVVECECCGGV